MFTVNPKRCADGPTLNPGLLQNDVNESQWDFLGKAEGNRKV